MKIISETSNYVADVRIIHLDAFPGEEEANLVENLRDEGAAKISLIALDDRQPVGHILFSKLSAPFKALSLAPVAIRQKYQRQGIGAALINSGLEKAKDDGWDIVIVLGDPTYYQRFGFSLDLAKNFDCPYAGPYLMALSLNEAVIPANSKITYPPAFG